FSGVGVGGGACGGDGGGDAGDRAADHGAAELDGAEAGVCEVLGGGGALVEPAVVGDVDDDLGSGTEEAALEPGDGVLEADAGYDADLAAADGRGEGLEGAAGPEGAAVFDAGLHLVDFFEEGDGVHEGDGLAEDDEVVFSEGFQLVVRGHDGE